MDTLEKACQDVHTIINMVGDADPTAKNADVKRMVYATSIHAITGITKCFGEVLCCYMDEKEGVSSIAVRIGVFQPRASAKDKDSINMMDSWLFERDCLQLLERCVDAPEDLKFAIIHDLLRNTFNRMETESTRQLLGYDPQDNFFEESEIFKNLNMSDELNEHNVKDDRQKSGLRDKLPEDKKNK